MRSVTVAIAAIPVVLGGLGIVALSGDLERLPLFNNSAGESLPTTAGDATDAGFESSDVAMEGQTGTAIDGLRPHLTVMEGHGNVVVSALIPALLPLLPAAAMDLSPLPRQEIGDNSGWAPLTSLLPGPNPSPARLSPANAPRPPLVNVPNNEQDRVSSAAVDDMDAPDPGRPDLPSQAAGSPPPHAGEQGPPPHAGEQVPPPHAGVPGPPPHAADNNSGNNGNNGKGNGSNTGKANASGRAVDGVRGLVDTGNGKIQMAGPQIHAGVPGSPPPAATVTVPTESPATITKTTAPDGTAGAAGDAPDMTRYAAPQTDTAAVGQGTGDTNADAPTDAAPSTDSDTEVPALVVTAPEVESAVDPADSGIGLPAER
ncbi:hypothetical protein NCCP2495_10200 [Dietzia sp. NCCP-2495]|uniref:hypothetical protein n=1 Tax=Dietzia sp. NCCP-2495 TaxID=2934675 RepID=UPI00222F17E0|nr:hypothetical protein [Dietzia sp. NCCP-2495]GLB63142.1 hypothetical protein NCCP2495_10200 [Dietzia sp. NCCP-2495]